MQKKTTETKIVIYNLNTTFKAIKAKNENEIRNVVNNFMEALKKALPIPSRQKFCLFLCPRHPIFSGKVDAPYQIPVQNESYRDDIVSGIFWIVDEKENIMEHFPYSICFSQDGVAFDAGPAENENEAASIVHNVIRENNHLFVTSMSKPENLVSRFILHLLSKSTQTII
ncbi:MAG: hypothetical protein WC666_00450 [Candidatus Paceibacterota bacterium]|jgi:hypothetical protein